ncbi:MAG: adenylate/guanylate cyclase domain-containing protein [Fimbriimonadaceae bacterium]
MTWSFRTALLIRFTIVLLIALGVAGLYTSWQVGKTANELSERVITQTSSLIDQRVDALLTDTEDQAKIVAGIARPTFAGPGEGAFDSRQFLKLAPEIVELIRVKPKYAAITITLNRTGEDLQVSQTPSGGISVRTTEITGAKQKVRRAYSPYGDRLLAGPEEIGDFPDPRGQQSFVKAKMSKQVSWTTADLLQNLPSGAELGTICSAPILDSEGRFLGVVSISITLTDLSRFLQTVKVSENGFPTLIELLGDRSKVIADPQPQRLMTSDAGGPRLITIDELSDEKLKIVAKTVENIPRFAESETRISKFKYNNEVYFLGFRRISGAQRPPWVLAVALPQNDFLNWSRETNLFFLTFTALALAVGAGVALLLANRVVRPLQKLVAETVKIKQFEWSETKPQDSHIREIDELSQSFETLKSGLRSMEKLVPADYARSLIASGQEAKLGGERRHITTYFGDIIGFTRLSHELPPEDLVEILAEYLDVLSDVVLNNDGTLDKFNGDDVMAFWGAPTLTTDHAKTAISAALKSLAAITELHIELRQNNMPILSASFGVATGDVIVGNVGSKKRMTYTVIGDSVNLASRLQGLNKFYSTHILSSHGTFLECEKDFVWRLVDSVSVFGRFEAEQVYEPLAFIETATPDQINLAKISNEAFALYQNRDFAAAAKAYEEILAVHRSDGPSSILHARCIKFLKKPPEKDWDGSYQMSLK